MKQQEQQPQTATIYIKGSNNTDWECSDVLCLEIIPAAVTEMRRIQQILTKEFDKEHVVSLHIFLRGVDGYWCRLEDEDEEELEFEGILTEIPEGYEESEEWDVRLYTTSVYKDGVVVFNGNIKHGDGEYTAEINIEQLEWLFNN